MLIQLNKTKRKRDQHHHTFHHNPLTAYTKPLEDYNNEDKRMCEPPVISY